MKKLRAVLVVTLALLGLQAVAPPADAASAQGSAQPRCTIVGTPGNDVLRGTPHRDVICGRGGDDRLLGRRGDDVLRGGRGDDRLTGGPGDDQLVGGSGDDHSSGGRGNDTLLGHDALTFTDVLRCGPGGADRAVADPPDDVGADCETVVRNDPPTDITLDPHSVPENQPIGTLVGHLTATDPDPGDVHTFALVAGTGDGDNGSFTVQGDEVRTQAIFNYEAVQELHLRVAATDQDGASFEKALVVTVTDVAENSPPVAVDDTFATAEDTQLDLPVSGAGSPAANDTDPNGDARTVTAVGGPTGGTVGIAAGTISFVPTANLCGAGAGGFDYTVSDGNGGSDVGHVTVDISCTPDPAVAHDDSATVIEDALATAVPVLANDSDADGDPLDIGSVTQPAHGTVVITGGGTGLTYAPDANYCNTVLGGSPDTFTYTLTGGNTATVSMTVTCVDDDPVAVADAATVTEDDPATAVDVLANDTDVDGGLTSITSVTQPAHGTVVITGGGTGLTYQPDANYCGADSFTYTRNGGSVATVSMTVTCVDDKPVAVDDSATVSEDAGATAVDVLANDTDVDGGAKSVASVTQGAHGTVAITGGGTGLTYDPDANYCGADSFTYDLNGGSTGTVSITVTCVDDAPVAVDDAKTVAEDSGASAVAVLANDTDVDGGTMSVASVTQGAHGAVVITGGGTGLTYEPDANYCGADSFTYDLNGGSTGTVTVTVTCVDDAPVAVDDAAAMLKNAAATAVDVLANDTDIDGGTKSITGVTQGGHGAVVITGGGTGLTYAPDAGYCNTDPGGVDDTFTYTLNGGSTATVSVTVACDAPPVAVDDAATLAEDDPATAIDVLANDTDVDGGPKSVVSVTQGTHGAVVITGGGTGLTYQPDANYCGADSFTYDLNGGSTGTVSITVTCVDDAPVAVDDSATVTEDDPATAVDVLGNDTDVDGGTKSVMSVTQGTHGAVVITGGGTGLTYQPDANYCGSDSFTYDLNGGSSATVSITVTCVNDAPVADDETFNAADSAVGNTSLVVDAPGDGAPAQTGPKKSISGDILTGDTDVDGPNPLAVVPGTFATNDGGSVTLQADGDFLFHPKAGTSCTDHSDSFDYTVTDGDTPTAGTDTGTVTIAIAGCVWYVDNTASGDGTATSPFGTLAQAQAASAAGDTIFVFKGDGTTTGYDAGIDLKANQQLAGEVIGLQVGSDALYAAVPGARPKLTDTAGDVVVLASGDTVTGFQLDPQGGGGISGGAGVASGTVADVRVIDTGTAGSQPGLELIGTSGTFAVSDLTVDSSGATAPPDTAVGVRLSNAGTVTFASGGTISITTKGAPGLVAATTSFGAGSVFDDITVTGSDAGGLALASTTGTTTFSALSLTTTSGATPAFQVSNAGTVTVTGAGTADVSATGGPAVDVTGTPGAALAFDSVTSTNSAGDGVNLAGLGSGTFTADDTSAITGAAGTGFDLDGGSGAVTFAGTITDDVGQLVRVQNTTGGTKTFSGAITDGGDGDGSGIAVTSNTGATVRFDGGLTLATGANAAFAATGGGTIAVTDPAGAASNTVQTTTGVAVDVVSTTIHADGLTFERISSNGAPVGIRLSATGSSGGLTVTGAGGTCTNGNVAGCSGGTIANGTGADSSAATPTGTGIVLDGTKDPSFTRMWLHDFSNYAVRGTDVSGLSLGTSVVNGANGDNANAPFADSSLRFDNLTGSASVTDSYISGGKENGFSVVNSSGSLDRLTVTGTTFGGGASARPANDALHLETSSSASQLKATVTGSTFSNAAGDLLGYVHGGTGAGDLVLTGNAFSNTNTAIATGGGGVTLTQSGVAGGNTTMNISNNTFRDAVGPGVLIVKSVGPATQSGTFANNTIGVSGVDNSGSAEGSALKLQLVDQGSSTWSVTGNQIYGYNNFGLEVLAGGGAPVAHSGTINTTVTGNTIAEPGNTAGTITVAKQGIHYNIGTVSGDTFTTCADIGGAGALANTIDASGADSTPSTVNVDVRLRQRQSTTIRLPGYGGGATDTAAVETFIDNRNSAGTTTLAAASGSGGGFLNSSPAGSACPQP